VWVWVWGALRLGRWPLAVGRDIPTPRMMGVGRLLAAGLHFCFELPIYILSTVLHSAAHALHVEVHAHL
jgi:hypothetical protein